MSDALDSEIDSYRDDSRKRLEKIKEAVKKWAYQDLDERHSSINENAKAIKRVPADQDFSRQDPREMYRQLENQMEDAKKSTINVDTGKSYTAQDFPGYLREVKYKAFDVAGAIAGKIGRIRNEDQRRHLMGKLQNTTDEIEGYEKEIRDLLSEGEKKLEDMQEYVDEAKKNVTQTLRQRASNTAAYSLNAMENLVNDAERREQEAQRNKKSFADLTAQQAAERADLFTRNLADDLKLRDQANARLQKLSNAQDDYVQWVKEHNIPDAQLQDDPNEKKIKEQDAKVRSAYARTLAIGDELKNIVQEKNKGEKDYKNLFITGGVALGGLLLGGLFGGSGEGAGAGSMLGLGTIGALVAGGVAMFATGFNPVKYFSGNAQNPGAGVKAAGASPETSNIPKGPAVTLKKNDRGYESFSFPMNGYSANAEGMLDRKNNIFKAHVLGSGPLEVEVPAIDIPVTRDKNGNYHVTNAGDAKKLENIYIEKANLAHGRSPIRVVEQAYSREIDLIRAPVAINERDDSTWKDKEIKIHGSLKEDRETFHIDYVTIGKPNGRPEDEIQITVNKDVKTGGVIQSSSRNFDGTSTQVFSVDFDVPQTHKDIKALLNDIKVPYRKELSKKEPEKAAPGEAREDEMPQLDPRLPTTEKSERKSL